jgi:hypothetical protein
MNKRPPALLIAIVGLYLLLEIVLLIAHPETAKAVRLFIAALLGFFMLRGSSVAIFIWASLSALAAIYGFVWMFRVGHANPQAAVIPCLFSALSLAQALYLLLSRSIRAHVASA